MPEGWTNTTLGGVAQIIGGGTPRTSVPEYWNGDIRWITPTEVTAQEGMVISNTERTITAEGLAHSGARLLPEGAVLLTSRATIGATALTGRPMATNQGFASLVARDGVVLPGYLMCWCQMHKEEFISRAGGNTFLEISKGKVRDIPIELPPLDAQRRIVDLGDAASATVTAAGAVATQGSALRHALLAAVVGGTNEGWSRTTLGDVASLAIGRTPPRNQSKYWTTDISRPFCTISDMQGWFVDPVREGVTEAAETDGKAKRVPAGSLLMSFKLTIGRVGFAARDLFPNEAIVWISVSQQDLDEEFLAIYLSSLDLTAGAGRAVKGNTLNRVSMRAIPVQFPPLLAQREIVALFRAVDGLVSAAKHGGEIASALRSSLLTDLLQGAHAIPSSYDALFEAA